jgi:hypothetical protein
VVAGAPTYKLLNSFFIYEHLSRCFILKESSSRFLKLFQVATIVIHGDIPRLVALVLGANRLFTMAMDTGGLHPIAIG